MIISHLNLDREIRFFLPSLTNFPFHFCFVGFRDATVCRDFFLNSTKTQTKPFKMKKTESWNCVSVHHHENQNSFKGLGEEQKYR